VHIVPPTPPRPSGACASGEARGGTRAPSGVEIALAAALGALKGVHTALVAAQSTEIRSAHVVAMFIPEDQQSSMASKGRYEEESLHKAGGGANRPRVQR
jgi:hypothetical protein